jgi:predicted SnoaL-like aldol condensation-catalyzing enzyme
MKVTPEQWLKILRAIQDGDCVALLESMLGDAYEEGKRDGVEIGREEEKTNS